MRWWLFLVLIIFALLIFLLIFLRVIDTDELAFLTAAYEITKGKLPYKDFFLPQMPLSFLLLVPFASLGITGFFLGRILYCLLGIIFGLLLLLYLYRRITQPSVSGILFLLLFYFFNGLFLAWIPTNKPHILVNIFNLLSLLGLYNGNYLLSGIFFGLAGETRAVFLFFLPFYLYYILRYKGSKPLIPFLLGFALSLVIGLYFFLLSPKNFFNNTIYYHLVRGAPSSFGEILYHRLLVLGKVFLLPQNFLMLIITLFAFRHYWQKRKEYHLEFFSLFLGGATFFIYYLVVAPAHFQYFIQVIPYLIVFNTPFLSSIQPYQIRQLIITKPLLQKALLGIAILYPLASFLTVYNYASAWRPFYQKYQLPLIKKVVSEIEKASPPEERILALFPCLPVLAGRRNLDDYETCPDFPFAERFSSAERRVLNLSTPEEIREKIRARLPSLVVGILGEREINFYELAKSGYKKIKEIEPYSLYQRGIGD